VLDMGGVVIPTLFESVAVAGFPSGPLGDDTEYRRVERGDLSERSYWASVAKARPDVDLATLWRTCSHVRREFSGALEAIAGRARLVAFTNDMAHWFGENWSRRFDELAIFDAIVEAAKLGVEKPDPEAFLLALAEVGEQPQHCLFVDDLDSNLEGAAGIGMNTLLFDVRDPAASVARLLERLDIPHDQSGPIRAFATPVRASHGAAALR
jgi:putative hydrolase of the HAD superfamily